MKKIIILSLLSVMSSVYAFEAVKDKVEVKPEVAQTSDNKTEMKDKINNQTFLYEFHLGAMGKADKSVYKYMTNNTDTVANVSAIEETMKKNWHLSSDYSKNLQFKSEHKVANQLVCNYTNRLVIKIKSYGDYSTNCPLKN